MEVHNRDLFPEPSLRQVYKAVDPLIANPLVDDAFLRHENAAVKAKRRYHHRGRLAMLLILLSALFTIAQALVIPRFPGFGLLSVIFILSGLLGLCLQIHLALTKQKEQWLLNRFAAERLRSIKFQAYPIAASAVLDEKFAEAVNAFYATQIARLDGELNTGLAALLHFSPMRSVALPETSLLTADLPLYSIACGAYRDLRIAYQRNFALAEIQSLRDKERVSYTFADILYLLGAFLSVLALIATIALPEYKVLCSWIDFLAVTSFVAGLMKAMADNAFLTEASKVRYEDYVRALDDCDRDLQKGNANLGEIVVQIERVALDELSDFCRAALQINYRL